MPKSTKPNNHHNIKEYRPQKNSRYSQGYIDPHSCHKLFESEMNKPIIYRSSWEKTFMKWCELSPKVKKWGSECISIKYMSRLDGQEHTYYPDFCLVLNDDTHVIVEIKPYNQVVKPNPSNEWATREYMRNISKWTTIKKKCEEKGYRFWIITEKTINSLGL